MHDIKWIREHPDAFDAAMDRRGEAVRAAELVALDKDKRAKQTRMQELQATRKSASKEIGGLMKAGEKDAAEAKKAEVNAIADEMKQLEAQVTEEAAALDAMLAGLPNIPDADVPDGADESDNIEMHTHGTPKEFGFEPKDHIDLGEALGMMDFESAAKISGARFVFLKGGLARLERALAQFMLDMHTTEFGYTEVQPPLLVRDEAMFGTGQLPKFAEDSFKTTNDYWMIATSEIALTNLVADTILNEQELPIRYTAYTPCFRSEAGSAGRDTRGMIRQHQFYKVELVSITLPEDSEKEHSRMLRCAEEVLKRLELPFRTVTLCTGDLGFGAQKTYDIEVWMPGQDAYREISSCSNTGAFQARRMKARFKRDGEKQTEFVHTLNGSALAVGRCLIAVIENYQQEDGSIAVPDALKPYIGGVDVVSAKD